MQLHPKQQSAIETNTTAVVSAGAGSGKTMVLTRRYVRLIAEGYDVEEILTLTFTRKAAAEMRERIQHALAAAAADTRQPAAVRDRAVTAVARFPQARITTLDSFCNTIVRESARSYGITPEFTTDEQQVQQLLQQECLGFLAEHRESPGMQAWLQDFSVERVLQDGLIHLAAEEFSIAEPRCWRTYIDRTIDESLQQAEGLLQDIERLGAVVSGCPFPDNKFVNAMAAMLRRYPISLSQSPQEQCTALEHLARGVRGIRRPSRYRAEIAPWVDAARELHDLLKQQALLIVNAVRTIPYLQDIGELCNRLQERVIERKRAAGVLSFADVAGLALHALLNQPELRSYHAGRIRRIMIDEFQDNNQLQQDLLFVLALKDPDDQRIFRRPPQLADVAEDKLFFVGDEKQSIFRFRRADVAIFRGLSEQVGSYGGQTINLDVNYRSEPRLIAVFNQLFPLIFGDARQEYEARFESLEPRDAIEGITPCIELWLNEYRERDEQDGAGVLNSSESEAAYLADWLAEAVSTGSLLVSDGAGGVRPAAYRDCAILFRSGGSVMDFEEALRQRGIPYNSMIMRSLFLEAPANDLYAVLQLAVYPEDRSAYAAVLRSPLVGLDDRAVLQLLLTTELPPFPEQEQLQQLGLPQDQQQRLAHARGMWQFLQEQYDRLSPAELLDYLWYDCGYRWFLLRNPDNHAYLEHFEYLREWFSRPGVRLPELLQELRERLGSSTKYDGEEIVREQQDAVRILTVHSSKGLGFPVVVLARAGQRPSAPGGVPLGRYRGEPVFMLSDPASASTERASLLVHNAAEEEDLQQEAELKRLLYVALTRVQQHLVVSGIDVTKLSPAEGTVERTFGGLLRSALGLELDTDGQVSCGSEQLTVRWIPRVARTVQRGTGWQRDMQHAADCLAGAAVAPPPEYPGTASVSELAARMRSGEIRQIRTPDGAVLSADTAQIDLDAGAQQLPSLDVDARLEQLGWEDRFGSLCHFILEQRVVRPDRPDSLLEIEDAAAGRFQSRLSDEDWLPLWYAARTLAEQWFAGAAAGELGIQPGRALPHGVYRCGVFPELQAEREFLLPLEVDGRCCRVRGIMDITLEYQDRALVLDYKTDRQWDPLQHQVQLWIYRAALQGITGKAASAYVASLRSGQLQYLQDA
ncbi:UvrD-helicase domain-containing protein [Spirochaeta africana]|uniref:DNA 3'-5' helicase n=1 Tax=Spirochaeta africana (strain ATCC 700263 / DSM 8902 / Z-7692) TaxID=889378 RepID=H9UFQ2_SPIAZ|nr:UvrD-helicase domain-containing protein [Spirochaeta africana]AFG36345.1 ATP-dependent exonuclase V beta subunit, helicase and exonuclease domain-containing [Spirochaeta africana DSM 8902]